MMVQGNKYYETMSKFCHSLEKCRLFFGYGVERWNSKVCEDD